MCFFASRTACSSQKADADRTAKTKTEVLMPVYEFACGQCGTSVEMYYKTSCGKETEFHWCNVCQQSLLHFKQIGGTSFILKGKGWAKDGYVNPTPGMPSGDAFLKQYRKEIADPEHPRKVGDLLRDIGRGRGDDLSDIGCPIRDLDADRHNKLHKGNEANLIRPVTDAGDIDKSSSEDK
jgi:predicted nucleic acid-binding Zn ribbon protein